MDSLSVIDGVLVFTSALMVVTLLLAWRLFDRPRHALTWAIAFACGTAQWTASGIGYAFFPHVPAFGFVAGSLVAAMTTLVTIGARQRAGLDDHLGRFAAGWAAATLALALVTFGTNDTGLRLFATNLYPALVLPLAIAATYRRGRPHNSTELFLALALLGFAALAMALALIAVQMEGPRPGDAHALYNLMLGFGLPPTGIALGVALSFVLAGDLAERLHALVTRDPLTGALNRRGLEQAAAGVMASTRRHSRDLTIVMADLDQFKSINDTRGHAAGDHALRRFADAANSLIRGDDLFARLGGDEFCLLLAEASTEAAMGVVERIRSRTGKEVTASFGVASLRRGERLEELIARADAALYRAKEDGRDRAICAIA